MIETHLLKLRRRDSISPAEEAVIRGAISEIRKVRADQLFIEQGQELKVSTLLLKGWMGRSRDLRGGERQITELHVAGDFVDLHSFTLKRLEHDILAFTDCTVAIVPHDKLLEITQSSPHLTRVYWFLTNLDTAIQRERAVSLARRSALSRMAHLMCELFVRLEIVGLTQGFSYDFPLTQAEMGEYLGLTSVHVNRTLQELRRRGLIRLDQRRLTVLALPELRRLAEFDPAYLYLDRERR